MHVMQFVMNILDQTVSVLRYNSLQ